MKKVKILSIIRLNDSDKRKIEAVDPAVELVDAGGWFDGEYRETWSRYATSRYVANGSNGKGTRAERDALLADAEIILASFPFPFDIRSRSPKLKWLHQRPAGASNLLDCDLWGSDVTVTTSRGLANAEPIAEWAIAGMMYFARDFNHAEADRASGNFEFAKYRGRMIRGKTACVIGAGGIGREVGRLCHALGMNVVGTKRTAPAAGERLADGFSALHPASDLHELLAQSEFVFVCCHWTPETTNLLDAEAFAAMKPDTTLVNVARGEIIDENAMLDALDSGHLRGAALDVYVGEFEGLPSDRMWKHPRVLITPHVSNATDVNMHKGIDLFCEYLDDYLKGRPLRNVIDWERTY
ncbi:MAG: D-2-hydroxyacid dehydrogenase [Alphaproteobacteria bacterium]